MGAPRWRFRRRRRRRGARGRTAQAVAAPLPRARAAPRAARAAHPGARRVWRRRALQLRARRGGGARGGAGEDAVLTPQSRTLSGTRPADGRRALEAPPARCGRRWQRRQRRARAPASSRRGGSEAEADDVISIEAAIGKTSAVSFKLSNVFEVGRRVHRVLHARVAAVFGDAAHRRQSSRRGARRPPALHRGVPGGAEYGKALKATRLITTDEMQWVYEVRGRPPARRGAEHHDGDRRAKQSKSSSETTPPPELRASHGTKLCVGGGAEPRRNARR